MEWGMQQQCCESEAQAFGRQQKQLITLAAFLPKFSIISYHFSSSHWGWQGLDSPRCPGTLQAPGTSKSKRRVIQAPQESGERVLRRVFWTTPGFSFYASLRDARGENLKLGSNGPFAAEEHIRILSGWDWAEYKLERKENCALIYTGDNWIYFGLM